MPFKNKPLRSNFPLTWAIFLLLAVLVFGLYANVVKAPFVYDDHELMLQSSALGRKIDVGKIWREERQKALTFLTFAVNFYFTQNTCPWAYRLVNIFIHIGAGFLLYWILLLLLETPVLSKTSYARQKNLFALCVALLFLAHPIQTQSVTYIWQRSESLSGLFLFAAYFLYLRGRLTGNAGDYLYAAVLFIAGFFAKGTIVAVFPLMALTEIALFSPDKYKAFFKKHWVLPLAGLGLAAVPFLPFAPARMLAHQLHVFFMDTVGMALSKNYFYTQFDVTLRYLRLTFVPLRQNIDHHVLFVKDFVSWPTPFYLAVLALILVWAVRIYKRYPFLTFGIFWFFACLLPTMFVDREAMWEHRLYMSMAGWGIFVAGLLFEFIRSRRWRYATFVFILATLSVLTVSRNTVWRTQISLLEDTVRKSPDKARPHQMLGVLYMREGDLKTAYDHLSKAVALRPDYADANNNLGLVYFRLGDRETAQHYFERAIQSQESFATAYINLATIALQDNDFGRAEQLLRKSLTYKAFMETYVALGNVFMARMDFDRAIENFQKARDIDPRNYAPYYSLGNAYFHQGKYPEALDMYRKALKLNPSSEDTYMNIGMMYFSTGDFALAKEYLKKAAELQPALPRIFYYLAESCRALNQNEEADFYSYKNREFLRQRGVTPGP